MSNNKLDGQVCPVAEHCWYNRQSDCWHQLRTFRYLLSCI